MKKVLVFDTETTGLPVDYSAPYYDVYNWPRVIELAWELCWENGDTINRRAELVLPDGWTVPDTPFHKEHGFTQEDSVVLGVPMTELLVEFNRDVAQANVLVAHNMGYDLPIIMCEMFRYRMRPEKKPEMKVCTKLVGEHVCKIPGFGGKYKWPTLAEAYRCMYKEDFQGAHHAGADVEACKQVYLWLTRHEPEMIEKYKFS